MKEKHNIDELFREKLAEHTSAVPDHLWSGIVNKRGRRRAGGLFGSGLFWLLISGGIMVGTGAYLSESVVSQNSSSVINMAHSGFSDSAIENIPTSSNQSSFSGEGSKSTATLNNDIIAYIRSDVNAHPEGSNSDINSEAGTGDIKESVIQGQSGGVDNSPSSTTKVASAGGVSSKGAGGNPFASANSSNGSGASNKAGTWGGSDGIMKSSTSGAFGLRTSMSTASIGGGLKATSEPTLLKIRPTDLNSAPLTSDPDFSSTPSPTVHGPKKSGWFADASAGYYKLDQKWENENSAGKDQRIDSETFSNAVDIGLRAGIQIKNGLTLSLGVLYSKASSTVSTTSSSTDTIVTTILDSVGFYQDTSNNVLVTIWDTVTTFSFEEIKNALRASNSYSLIQIPVSVGYSVQKGRFQLGVNVGASFDFLISNSSSYPILVPGDTSTNTLDETQVLALMSGRSSIRSGLSLFGNLSISYILSEKLHILLEPTFRSNTIPFDKGGPPFVKLNYYGIRGGLRYFF